MVCSISPITGGTKTVILGQIQKLEDWHKFKVMEEATSDQHWKIHIPDFSHTDQML